MSSSNTPRPTGDQLQLEVEKLRKGSNQKRKQRKSQLTTMTATKLRSEMKRFAIPDKSNGEAGIMRVQIMRACGLGIPPHKQWTAKSIQYMLEEVYHQNTDDLDLTSKVNAAKILQDIINEEGEQEEAEHLIRYENLAKQLEAKGEDQLARTCRNLDQYEEIMSPSMGKVIRDLLEITEMEKSYSSSTQDAELTIAPTPKALFTADPHTRLDGYTKKRKELLEQNDKLQKQIRELEEPTMKRTRSEEISYETMDDPPDTTPLQRNNGVKIGSLGIQWMTPTDIRSADRASTFMNRNPTITSDDNGWEQILNFSNTMEKISYDHPILPFRGIHFFTACAMAVKEIENINDTSGFGSAPTAIGNEELAREWLGLLYTDGVSYLGSGSCFEQIRFSKAARKGLAGAGSNPPDPSHVATFFSQLTKAGEENRRRRGGQRNTGEKHQTAPITNPHPYLPHAKVPEPTLDTIITTAMSIAPDGMSKSIIETAARTIASKPGATFRDKQIGGLKALGQGTRSKDQERHGYQELDWSTVTTARQITAATVNLSVEALESARITAGNVTIMNLGHDYMKKCILCLLQRKFSGGDFKLHLLIPRTSGAPSEADLIAGMGEAQLARREGTIPKLLSEDKDRQIYMWFRLAIETMITADAPSLDFGFTAALRFFADHTMFFQANGTPLCLVTRALCNTMMAAQRQREQVLMHPTHPDELLLSYKEPADIATAKQRLMEWSRDGQADEIIRFQRCIASRGEPDNLHQPPRTQRSGAGSSWEPPNQHEKTKSVQFAQVVDKTKRSPISGINPNSMDKAMWKKLYGDKKVNGKTVSLCWFNCNRINGCVLGNKCQQSHDSLPAPYMGKKFPQMSEDKQQEVLTQCSTRE